ncbi:MAG: hypothetical protein DELT_02905 [Desulfovibrio sp.]
MNTLKKFSDLDIDWDLAPEDAVTMYLEWGNNDWRGAHSPVRSKSDISRYFVVDTWNKEPIIRLVERNSEGAEDLAAFPLPETFRAAWAEEFGTLKGVFAPTDTIREWLKTQL